MTDIFDLQMNISGIFTTLSPNEVRLQFNSLPGPALGLILWAATYIQLFVNLEGDKDNHKPQTKLFCGMSTMKINSLPHSK